MTGAGITLDGVTFAYAGGPPVLRGVSLALPAGTFAVLVGPNGGGKSTLARHLIGLLRPQQGSVSIGGENIAGLPVGRIARKVGFAFQNPELQIFSPTVYEEVAFGSRNMGLAGEALAEQVRRALARFDLNDMAQQPPAALSFSHRRRVALASIAAMDTPVVVLDEPTVGLDAPGRAQVLGWLAERHRAGCTVLLVTHDMEAAFAHAQRLLVMLDGQLVMDGPPAAVYADEALLHRAGLRQPFLYALGRKLGLSDPTPDAVLALWRERAR